MFIIQKRCVLCILCLWCVHFGIQQISTNIKIGSVSIKIEKSLNPMEKFSQFNDNFTGINPFTSPKYKKISIKILVRAIIKFPIYVIYKLGFPVIHWLISIKKLGNEHPSGIIYSNSVTEFDKDVINHVFGIRLFKYNHRKTCVIFPENTTTNNKSILNFKDKFLCDYTIGLRYSKEAIYMYGSYLEWLVRFLGTSNHVTVNCMKGNDLPKTANLPYVQFTREDKRLFMDLLKQ